MSLEQNFCHFYTGCFLNYGKRYVNSIYYSPISLGFSEENVSLKDIEIDQNVLSSDLGKVVKLKL